MNKLKTTRSPEPAIESSFFDVLKKFVLDVIFGNAFTAMIYVQFYLYPQFEYIYDFHILMFNTTLFQGKIDDILFALTG